MKINLEQMEFLSFPLPFADCDGCKENCSYDWPVIKLIEHMQRLKIEKVAIENKLIPIVVKEKLLKRNCVLLEELLEIQKNLYQF